MNLLLSLDIHVTIHIIKHYLQLKWTFTSSCIRKVYFINLFDISGFLRNTTKISVLATQFKFALYLLWFHRQHIFSASRKAFLMCSLFSILLIISIYNSLLLHKLNIVSYFFSSHYTFMSQCKFLLLYRSFQIHHFVPISYLFCDNCMLIVMKPCLYKSVDLHCCICGLLLIGM